MNTILSGLIGIKRLVFLNDAIVNGNILIDLIINYFKYLIV